MSADQKDIKKSGDVRIIDLLPVAKAVKKGIPWIIIAALFCGVLALLVSKFLITPTYRTSFRVYVNNALDTSDKTSVSSSDLSASRSLAATYSEIIKGRTVLTAAAKEAGLNVGYGQLNKMADVSTGNATEIITVNVTTADPSMSLRYAESIIKVAQEQVSNIVDGSSMRVIDEPYLPAGIYSPSYKKNVVLGAFFGAVLMLLFITLRALLDNRVRDEQTLEERFGYAILGSIPNQNAAGKAGKNYSSYSYGGAEREAQK